MAQLILRGRDSPSTGSQAKVLLMAHYHSDSSQAKPWANQKLGSCVAARSREPARSRGSAGRCPRAWLLLILPDRKYVTNVRCPDRRRLPGAPGTGCPGGAVRSS